MFRIRRDGKKRQRKKRAGLSGTHKMRAPRKPRNRGGRVLVKGGGKPFVAVVSGGVNPKRAITGIENPAGDVGILGAVEKPSDDPLKTLMAVSWDKVQKTSVKIAIALYKALFSA